MFHISHNFRFLSLCLIILAIAARMIAALALHGHDPASIYTYEHGEIARNLLAGRGFSVELLGTWGLTSQQAPLVPWLLAACYLIAGVNSAPAHLLFFAIQSLEGGLMVAGLLLLASRLLTNKPLILIAGLWASLHPPLVYAATHIQVVSTAIMILVWLFVALDDVRQTMSPRSVLKAGLLMGLAALTDPILVLAGVGATLAWLLFDRPRNRPDTKRLIQAWLGLVCVSVAMITPWSLRNAQVHGHFVFIKSTFGYAFWQGNNRLSIGTDKVMRPSVNHALTQLSNTFSSLNQQLWQARHIAGCVDDIALSPAQKRQLGQLPESERSAELMRQAISDLHASPGRYRQLCLRRLRYFLWMDDSNPKTLTLFYQLPHAFLTITSLLGLLLMGHPHRNRLAPSCIGFLLTALFHSLTITAPRFHLPWEPLMILWAICGLSQLRAFRITNPANQIPLKYDVWKFSITKPS